MPDPTSGATVRVGLNLRVVPNGVDPASNRLRATLIVTPRRLQPTDTTAVCLASWPLDVVTHLAALAGGGGAGFPLRVQATTPTRGAAPQLVQLVDPQFLHLGEHETGLSRVTDSWSEALGRICDDPWAPLIDDIDRSDAGKQKTDGLGDSYAGQTAQSPIDDTGALRVPPHAPDATLNVTAVVVNPQAKQAIRVEADRAKRVGALLAGAVSQVASPPEAPAVAAHPMAPAPCEDVIVAAKKKAFMDRFAAMVTRTTPSRGRAAKVFRNAAHAMDPTSAAPVQLGRPAVPDCFATTPQACGAVDGAPLDEANAFAAHAGHVYGSWPQQPLSRTHVTQCAPGAASPAELAKIHAIYFTLQGDPLLARLFGFAFDMTFALPKGQDGEQTLYLAAEDRGLWTAARLGAAEPGKIRPFWPAPRDFSGIDDSVPRDEQRDGVVRFDALQTVTSVDVRGAVSDALDGIDRGGPHRTIGFSFLDAVAADRTARDLAVAKSQLDDRKDPQAPLVLYAEELVTGRRLDVRVGTQWRSLMQRYVGHPRLHRDIRRRLDDVARLFEGGPPCDGRRFVEETSFQRLARALPVAGGKSGDVEAIVEEAYLTWGGAPLGALACKSDERASAGAPIMPVARTYDLPGADFASRPPPLRFGVPYLFGMRDTYLGGGGPSRAEAEQCYGKDVHAVLPNTGKAEAPKRFLRHEAIAAPVLMLPAALVPGPAGPMGFEPPASAILRTAVAGDGLATGTRDEDPPGPPYIDAAARASGSSTFRVLVAPRAGLDFCASHGVFDKTETAKEALAGGLLDVLFLDEMMRERSDTTQLHRHTGFPVAKVSRAEGFNADQLIYRRQTGGLGLDTGGDEALGATVFQSLPDARRRPAGYGYMPDPAARTMALRLRVADADIYLQGAVCVPLYDADQPCFPHAMPVLVEIVKQDRLRTAPAQAVGDVVTHVGVKRYRSDSQGVAERRGGVKVQHVRVTLARYEQFDLEATCLPEAGDLARWFSLVESLGVQTVQAQTNPACAGRRDAACGPQVARHLDQQFGRLDLGRHSGLAGALTCSSDGLATIAERLLTFMRETRPLTEIAGVTMLRMAHALNAPAEAPALRNVCVARTDEHAPAPTSAAPVRFASKPGATHMLLTGEIEVDLEQVGAIEINAYAVEPDGKSFDDPARGRGLLSRRAGRWPGAPAKGGKRIPYLKQAVFGFDVTAEGRAQPVPRKLTLLRIENLPDPRVALAILRAKTKPGEPPVFLGQNGRTTRLDLGVLYRAALSGTRLELPPGASAGDASTDARILQVVRPHDIVDTRARMLGLEAVGVSRFARAFETAPMYDAEGKEHVLQRRRPLRARDQRKTGERGSVQSLSTSPPAAVGLRSPLPYFRIERCAVGEGDDSRQLLTRKCGVRLRFDRGWFSAGEGERLGIVLWPPAYREQKPDDLERNRVYWNDRWLDLNDFRDSDLGDGGPFISRWGGDPIRADPWPQRSWFMPPSAFACLDRSDTDAFVSYEPGAPARAHDPRYVSKVSMPIEVDPLDPDGTGVGQTAGGGTGQGDATPPKKRTSRLDVSLLTFEPYFDIEAEEWYVEVPLSLARVTDPFIRLGLVRYQPNALGDMLTVSTPVRVWTQLPPVRSVVVTSRRGREVTDVLAVARGQASAGIKPFPIDAPALMDWIARPRMRLTVLHENDDALGVRRQVCVEAMDAAGADVSPEVKNGEFQWTMRARIDDEALEDLPEGRLVAWIEEVELRLPATYSNEPRKLAEVYVDAYKDSDFATSGPRFLAKIPFRNHPDAPRRRRRR